LGEPIREGEEWGFERGTDWT